MPALADRDMEWPVVETVDIYDGYVIRVRRDTLRNADGSTFTRDVVAHLGSVGVVVVDDEDRVLILTQYRHPARQRMVEIPAGLLDQPGEDPLVAAKRELAEEGHTKAARWSPLLRLMLSPGISDEVITIYLAEGVSTSDVPAWFVADDEESTMTREWAPLAEVVEAVLAGAVKNAALAAGVLAAWVRRQQAGG